MRKIKLKLTPQHIIELCSLVQATQEKLTRDILLDVKEIQVYRLSNAMKLHRRLAIMSLRITVGKFSVLSFDFTEQLTIRYCLLNTTRRPHMQTILATIDKTLHPSMFERNIYGQSAC